MDDLVLLVATSHFEKGDDDCACSDNLVQVPSKICLGKNRLKFRGDAIVVANAQFQLISSHKGYFAVLGTLTRRILDVFSKPITLETAKKYLADMPPSQVDSITNRLSNFGFLTFEEDCACVSVRGDDASIITNPLLTSWLHLTDRCNLRCDYCYLSHVREDMSFETGRAAIDATFRSALANNFKQVKFKYAGGEPLLRFSLITELHCYVQSLAEKYGVGATGAILSNGTLLTDEMAETLKSLNLRLMISLDGLGQYHDLHRKYVSGRGSFSDAAEAIELAISHGLTPNISVTVSSRTADGLPGVIAWILERNLPFSLNFYRENELSASHEDMRLDEQKIISGMLAAFKVIENNLPRRPFLGGIIDRANLSVSHTHTCGVGQNYLVFDQHGQVSKCQMQIKKPITDSQTPDPLAIIRADQSGTQNISVEEKEGCKNCEWKHWCAGGCPLATHRATGKYDVKSPNCNIYKALFPEALRLEGLRLLKYKDDPEVVMAF